MMKNPELAKQMRTLRTVNHFTQQQVADILNIDRTTYTSYEISKNTPDIMLLDAFAKIFSVSIDFILNIDTKHPEALCDEVDEYETSRSESLVSQLSRAERTLLAEYRVLSEEDQQKVQELVSSCNPMKKQKAKSKKWIVRKSRFRIPQCSVAGFFLCTEGIWQIRQFYLENGSEFYRIYARRRIDIHLFVQ